MANISIKGGRAPNNATTLIGSIIAGILIPVYIAISNYETDDYKILSKRKVH